MRLKLAETGWHIPLRYIVHAASINHKIFVMKFHLTTDNQTAVCGAVTNRPDTFLYPEKQFTSHYSKESQCKKCLSILQKSEVKVIDENYRVKAVRHIKKNSANMMLLNYDKEKKVAWELRNKNGSTFILMTRGMDGADGFDIYYPEQDMSTTGAINIFDNYKKS